MSALTTFSAAWRHLLPRPDLHGGSRQLVAALKGGASLGEALTASAEALAKAAVHDAAGRFEGGALALVIVDVRNALERQLREAATGVKDAALAEALCHAARAVTDEAFVGHLINALLAATDLYTEAHALERLDEARAAREVTALLTRSRCVLVSRSDAARTEPARPSAVDFIPFPQPSRP